MKIVEVHIVIEGEEFRVPLGRFRDMLKAELGSVATILRQTIFEQRFDAAIAKTIQKIREPK